VNKVVKTTVFGWYQVTGEINIFFVGAKKLVKSHVFGWYLLHVYFLYFFCIEVKTHLIHVILTDLL